MELVDRMFSQMASIQVRDEWIIYVSFGITYLPVSKWVVREEKKKWNENDGLELQAAAGRCGVKDG